MKDIKNNKKLKERLETLEKDLLNVDGALEAIENSLYFASERKDIDLTKPNAKCLILVNMIVKNCIGDIEDMIAELG